MLSADQQSKLEDLCSELELLVTTDGDEILSAYEAAASAATGAASRGEAAERFRASIEPQTQNWCWSTLGDEVFDPPEQGEDGLPLQPLDELTDKVADVTDRILDLLLPNPQERDEAASSNGKPGKPKTD